MLCKPPVIKYLKLDIKGAPKLLEEVTELGSAFAVAPHIMNVMIEWEFKVFEPLEKNRLLVDSKIYQEHQTKRFIEISTKDVEHIINSSYEAASDLLEKELKFNQVFHRPKSLSLDELEELSQEFHANLRSRLF